jgi:glycosyltransferase involved in cell wall biosynthesis
MQPISPTLNRNRRSLVYIGWNRWDTIWQRSHHLAHHLSRFFYVLYVDPVAYSLPGYLRSRLKGDQSRNLWPKLRSINPNLVVFTPPPLLPFSLENRFINDLDHALLAKMVTRVMRKLAMARPILWLTYPLQLPLVGKLGEMLVCYDCMDNYPAFYPPDSARTRLTASLEDKLLTLADLVTATALSLQKRLRQKHAHVHLLRNGVGQQFLTYRAAPQSPPPPDWPPGDGPVIGYMGMVSRWLDFEAIRRLAGRHPDWRLLFIGPSEVNLNPYRQWANLHFLGPKPYDILTDYAIRFDVSLIPFQINDLTLDVNPVKIYEYFALGKPVVAARLPELQPFAGLCYLAANTDEFIRQVEQAVDDLSRLDLTAQQASIARRQAIARANTWQQRAAELAQLLETSLAMKQVA